MSEPTERDLELTRRVVDGANDDSPYEELQPYVQLAGLCWTAPTTAAHEMDAAVGLVFAKVLRALTAQARRGGRVEGLREGAQIIRHEPHTCMTEGHCDELHQVQRDAAERCEARAAELEATDE